MITYTHPDYAGFTFANADALRTGPLGEVADYQIVAAPADMKSEIGSWLTLPTTNIIQSCQSAY